ncbi:uncharacterized protein CBL_13018 [Carabus blaptoides fortunei]
MKTITVEEEYAKNKYLKREDVKNLMNWAEKQSYLPKISELEIILFLHSCYNSQEAAKVTIDNYYTCRTHCPEFFENRDSSTPALQKSMEVMIFQPLPKPTDRGHRIILVRFMDTDPTKFVYSDQLKILIMSMDLWVLQEGTAEGHEIIFDLTGITLSHLSRVNPLTLKKLFYYLQEALPFRLKGLHFFNIVSFMDRLMLLMRPFIKKELFNVLYMHTSENIGDMFKTIPQSCLPSDYGGEAPSLEKLHAQMKTNLIENVEYFKQEEIDQRVNEKKRPGRAKSAGDIWGKGADFKKCYNVPLHYDTTCYNNRCTNSNCSFDLDTGHFLQKPKTMATVRHLYSRHIDPECLPESVNISLYRPDHIEPVQ